MDEKTYVVLIEAQGEYYLMASDDNSIQAFKTETKGIQHFEAGYNDCHRRGYSQSMSALINAITFRPSIIESSSLEFITNHIVDENPKIVKLINVSGHMKGITTRPEAAEYWKNGTKPKMISGEFRSV